MSQKTEFNFSTRKVEEEIEYPSYSDPGRILVHVLSENKDQHFLDRFKVDVVAYECGTSVFYVNEGMGIDYWINWYIDEFPGSIPGYYVIEGIRGAYHRGDGWSTDDDEEWEYESIRPATEEEIRTEDLSV